MKQQQLFQDTTWNWRKYFSRQILSLGEADERNGYIEDFQSGPDGKSAGCITVRGFRVKVLNVPTTPEELDDYPDWNLLPTGILHSDHPDYYANYYSCDCSQGVKGILCRHLAALMIHWEKIHGPFVMDETPEDKARRLAAVAKEAVIRSKKALKFPAADYFKKLDPLPKNSYFNVDRLLAKKEAEISQYDAEQADQYLAENKENNMKVSQGYVYGGEQALELNDFPHDRALYPAQKENGCAQGSSRKAGGGSLRGYEGRPAEAV